MVKITSEGQNKVKKMKRTEDRLRDLCHNIKHTNTQIIRKVKKKRQMMSMKTYFKRLSVQLSSIAQSCPTLCNAMNRGTPCLPVHHQLPEFTQTHVHQVSDAIQPSQPLSSPSPPAPKPSQHQSLFQ